MAHYTVKRTDEEIDAVLNDVAEQMDVGGSKFPGMTYEEGVQNAINWLTGQVDDNPMDD